ncbi:hypothetical protein VF14_18210 [Nostoc linckia z18]|nr:hypothetical protein [Nostoc linckia]PHJ52294.1 hypothetical protein VF02_37705 [Nostoc linckia z1]PHJ81492.1 hypothetical protein VF04_37590 [Nostoc linckia z7]PHK09335.1 hypothetical protein VF09_16095 [Nostoc linckia z9]PHK33061.1 hypothetical protein VF14_18210 [Nostoc linckia z18]
MNGYTPGEGKRMADDLAAKLPFRTKTTGNLEEEDVQYSAAIKTGMKDQANYWKSYADNMEDAIGNVPEVIENQHRVRAAVLNAGAKVVASTAKLDETGAKYMADVTKATRQTTNNVNLTFGKGRLAVQYLQQTAQTALAEAQSDFGRNMEMLNHRHQTKEANAQSTFKERLAVMRKGKETYTLQEGDISW